MMKDGKIGVRIPATPVTLNIVEMLGKPITSTSANKTGGKEPYDIPTVLNELGDTQVDLILDTGPMKSTQVSTIVEIVENTVRVLREGPINLADMEKLVISRDQ
jgi:L-threonylcarbamoyladenylate synthase